MNRQSSHVVPEETSFGNSTLDSSSGKCVGSSFDKQATWTLISVCLLFWLLLPKPDSWWPWCLSAYPIIAVTWPSHIYAWEGELCSKRWMDADASRLDHQPPTKTRLEWPNAVLPKQDAMSGAYGPWLGGLAQPVARSTSQPPETRAILCLVLPPLPKMKAWAVDGNGKRWIDTRQIGGAKKAELTLPCASCSSD